MRSGASGCPSASTSATVATHVSDGFARSIASNFMPFSWYSSCVFNPAASPSGAGVALPAVEAQDRQIPQVWHPGSPVPHPHSVLARSAECGFPSGGVTAQSEPYRVQNLHAGHTRHTCFNSVPAGKNVCSPRLHSFGAEFGTLDATVSSHHNASPASVLQSNCGPHTLSSAAVLPSGSVYSGVALSKGA